MHDTSFNKMSRFVEKYLGDYRESHLEILDIGSQAVEQMNSYRPLFNSATWHYRGLDIVSGENVDIVATSPYNWSEVKDGSIDVVVSGQALEHIEFPWETVREIARILKPGGIACLIAPSSGKEHRYPNDCWRIYPDGMRALAKLSNLRAVEIFTDWGLGEWQDTFAVMQKPRAQSSSSVLEDFDDRGVARSLYKQAILSRPLNSKYYVSLGQLLLEEEKPSEAALALAAGLMLSPQDSILKREFAEALRLTVSKQPLFSSGLNALKITPQTLATLDSAFQLLLSLSPDELRLAIRMQAADTFALKKIAYWAGQRNRGELVKLCIEELLFSVQGDFEVVLGWAIDLRKSGPNQYSSALFQKALELQLQCGTINRTTVIQHIIFALKAKSYLEIGVERGINFLQIQAPLKYGVDPKFEIPGGTDDTDKQKFFSVSSDEFFAQAFNSQQKFDLIFIDGLHRHIQALRDIENSLRLLTPKGVIIVHDCLPKSEAEACPSLEQARQTPGFDGNWTGDVYKAILQLRSTRKDLLISVLEADHGIGIITRGNSKESLNLDSSAIEALSFGEFKSSAKELLNLKPVRWFFEWLQSQRT